MTLARLGTRPVASWAVLSLAVLACTRGATPPAAPSAAGLASPPAPDPTGPTPAAAASGLEPTASPDLLPMSAFQQGVSYTAWRSGELFSAESDKTLAQVIKPMGVTWISLVVTCCQAQHDSTEIQCQPETATPTDAEVTHGIEYAHRLGLRVLLKPHVDLADEPGGWRGENGFGDDETAWSAGFAGYTTFITHYAALAQAQGADYFSVGTELVKTSSRPDQWRAVVKAVRQVYGGPLTHASNAGEEVKVQWWDALDAIGVDAYYPLTDSNQPTLAQLKEAWTKIAGRLAALSTQWGRPIIFTEVGYRSVDGANREPWNFSDTGVADPQEQADCYQALFETRQGQPGWHGVFWWGWTTNSNQGGPADLDYTANHKPAEAVLRASYGQSPRPAPTATAVLAEDVSQQFVIFADAPGDGWHDWSWDYAANYSTPTTAHTGKAAIQVTLKPWGALVFYHAGLDTSPYYWLEFYLNAGSDTQRPIAVSVNNGTDAAPPPVNLMNPLYLQGGQLTANQWQRVRIPLVDLGADRLTDVRIALRDSTGNGQKEFFLDELRLVGAIPSP